MFDGNTALHLAAQGRDAEMCRILLRAHVSLLLRTLLQNNQKMPHATATVDTVL